jgi:DNA-binding IclR family transcriptional regulator
MNSHKYKIGTKLYFLGSLYLSTEDIVRTADPVIKTLNQLTNETVFVGIFDRGNVVHIMKEESRHPFRLTHTIGTILPAYATAMGKAFLSELTEAEIDSLYPDENLVPLTKHTIATKTELKRELEQVRKTGVAFNKGEYYEGIWCISALLHGASGRATAALSIVIPTFRMGEDTLAQLAMLVRMGASLISFRLGYLGADPLVTDIEDIRSWWNKEVSDSASQANIRATGCASLPE